MTYNWTLETNFSLQSAVVELSCLEESLSKINKTIYQMLISYVCISHVVMTENNLGGKRTGGSPEVLECGKLRSYLSSIPDIHLNRSLSAQPLITNLII